MSTRILLLAWAATALAGCSSKRADDAPPAPATDGGVVVANASDCPPDERVALKCPTLASYGLFADAARQVPAAGVTPYDVVAPLYSDRARKRRFVSLPPGAKLGYREGAPWELPLGAILVKTFFYPVDERDVSKGDRLVETRLLARGPDGIAAVSYVWNDAQTEARRAVAGADVPVRWRDADGHDASLAYVVPDTNKCTRCHGAKSVLPLGLRTEQLDRTYAFAEGVENQIDRFARLGLLEGAPPPAPRTSLVAPSDATASVDARARSYLFANCAHCHSPTRGAAEWSGLSLELADTAPATLKPCRIVTSAGDTGGLTYDIVPGHPEQSILPYRMALEGSAYRMPEGSRTPDKEGVALVTAWIAAMPARSCQ